MGQRVTRAEFREYRRAVFSHWSAVLIGAIGIVIMIAQAVGKYFEIDLWPWWATALVVVGALHWGQFLAWLDAKRERDVLRKYNISREALDRLADYRNQLVTIQNAHINSQVELGTWIAGYQTLRSEIVNYLSRNLSPAESKLFERLGLYAIYHIPNPPALDDNHTNWRSRVVRDHFWLAECVRDHARRKLRPDEEEMADGHAVAEIRSG